MTLFAPKTVNLAATVPTSVIWTANDIQLHTGYAVIDSVTSMAFTITNPGNNTVYFSLSYRTLYGSVSVVERQSLGGISGGATSRTIRVSSKEIPALGSLSKDITSITLSLVAISAINNVVIQLEVIKPDETPSGSGVSGIIGQDTTLTVDVELLSILQVNTAIAAGASYVGLDATDVDYIYKMHSVIVNMPITPYQNRDVVLSVTIGAFTIARISSVCDEPLRTTIPLGITLPMGATITLTVTNTNPLDAVPANLVEVVYNLERYLR